MSNSRFAKNTSVPVERTRAEIERALRVYGCDAFAFGWAIEGAMIQFSHRGRSVKVSVPTPQGKSEAKTAQLERQRWRILLLLIKAQIEAVEIGLATFEEAFLPWMLLADGSTVAQRMIGELPAAKEPLKLKAAR